MSELQVVKLRRLVPIRHCNTSSSSISIEQTDTNEDIELESEPHPIINKERLEAQKLYYETHPVNPSPLMQSHRIPVHERLGNKSSVRLKRFVPLGTNTSTILPKRRLIRTNNFETNGNNPAQFRQNRVKRRLNLAQRRYENIRRANSQQGPIRLKRLMKKSSSNNSAVKNFTVQVKNNNFKPSEFIGTHYVQRFRMILDPEIQKQIQTLQEENDDGLINDVIPSSLIEIVTHDNTSLSINERFKMLSY